jgi:hypothetical protein
MPFSRILLYIPPDRPPFLAPIQRLDTSALLLDFALPFPPYSVPLSFLHTGFSVS